MSTSFILVNDINHHGKFYVIFIVNDQDNAHDLNVPTWIAKNTTTYWTDQKKENVDNVIVTKETKGRIKK